MNQRALERVSVLVSALLLAVFICFYHLDRHSFKPSDESLHVKATQHMLQTGDLWTPIVDGEPYFRKPPFKMWLSLIPVSLFGESNFSYRFVDAASAVLTTLLTCLAGSWLLGSWIAGGIASVALLGCRYFILYHCARNAVQDSMLVLLSTAATLVGYQLVSSFPTAIKLAGVPAFPADSQVATRKRRRLALLGGLLVGLAVLTKSIAGFLPLLLVGLFAACTGRFPIILRTGSRTILLVLVLSLLPAALYFGSHAIFHPQAFKIFFQEELYDRFREGMHNTYQRWFYFRGLFVHNSAVPPLLLAASLCWGVAAWLKTRNQAVLFLLIWAVFPVVGYGLLSSRMPWYIAPAFPAMSLLVGGLFGWLYEAFSDAVRRRARFAALLLFLCHALAAILLISNLAMIWLQIVAPNSFPFVRQLNYHEPVNTDFHQGLARWAEGETDYRVATDRVSTQIRSLMSQSNRHLGMKILGYKLPAFAQHESIYISMLEPMLKRAQDSSELSQALAGQAGADQVAFVITPASELPTLRQLRAPTSFAVLPPENRFSPFSWHRRFEPVVVLSYLTETLENQFIPVSRTLSIAPELRLSGFTDDFRWGESEAVGIAGPRAILLFEGDRVLREFGGQFALSAGFHPRAKAEPLKLSIFCNEQKLGELVLSEAQQRQEMIEFPLPTGAVTVGKNVLTFLVQRPDKLVVGSRETLVALRDLQVAIDWKE